MNRLRPFGWVGTAAWLLFSHVQPGHSAPYIPADDRQVLEQLPSKGASPAMQAIRMLRADLFRDPHNLDLATELAARYIEEGRSEADPRMFGRAEAALAPWWDQPVAPSRVLLLKAIIRQNAHEFDSALADLDTVLLLQPMNAQAWLTKATLLQVLGRYKEAQQACRPLAHLSARHIGLTCGSDIAGLTGQAKQSREILQWVVDRSGVAGQERQWALMVLAELLGRTGQPAMAEPYFLEAIRLGIKNPYLLGAYADLLLDQGRARAVLDLLKDDVKADGLLLRLALAQQALRLPAAKQHTAVLAARFAASRNRGTRIHLREEARFTLTLLAEPKQALALAQDNWAIQKEPWDARLLLECALAADNWIAAQPVLDWMTTNHIEDMRLQDLAARLTKGRS